MIFAALCWCKRFPDHEDALIRLGPLITIDRANTMGAAQLTRVTARVLYHQEIDALIVEPFKLAVARATLGSLFSIGETFPLAEKLARIYLIRWLRDGRIFRPAFPIAQAGTAVATFDQRLSLAESLLTLMTHAEFTPSTQAEDGTALAKFCDWVGQWEASNLKGIASLVEELTDRFGLPHLWQRMLPEGRFGGDNAADWSTLPLLG
jgi:hypothetical protein